MEYERKFWINSKIPTGYASSWPKVRRPAAIPEKSYPYLKELIEKGKTMKEIAKEMGCSVATVRKVKSLL